MSGVCSQCFTMELVTAFCISKPKLLIIQSPHLPSLLWLKAAVGTQAVSMWSLQQSLWEILSWCYEQNDQRQALLLFVSWEFLLGITFVNVEKAMVPVFVVSGIYLFHTSGQPALLLSKTQHVNLWWCLYICSCKNSEQHGDLASDSAGSATLACRNPEMWIWIVSKHLCGFMEKR